MTLEKPRRGRPRGGTSQGESTRRLLFDTAKRLFAERGFDDTTLRAVAMEAGVSPGLIYRYFPSKRAVARALYDELSTEYANASKPLPDGTWAQRFFHAIDTVFAVLGPHRKTLSALNGVWFSDGDAGLFADGAADARGRVMAVFSDVVTGASDPPPAAAAFARVLYVAHLALILGWLLDRSPDQAATHQGLESLATVSTMAAVLLRFPGAVEAVRATDRFVRVGLLGQAKFETGDAASG